MRLELPPFLQNPPWRMAFPEGSSKGHRLVGEPLGIRSVLVGVFDDVVKMRQGKSFIESTASQQEFQRFTR